MPSSEGSESPRDEASGRIDGSAWALVAIFLLAVVFRLYGIETRDVWIDEANGILTASRDLPALLDRLRLDSSPPLYYLILHFWIALFGDGAVALRSLSGLFSLGLVAATYAAGRTLISRPAGLFAAFFMAVSPVQAYYSQQARMYTLLPVLALLSVAFLVRHLREGRRVDYRLWIVTTVLALYCHNFAIYLLPVHVVLVAVSGRLFADFRHWALAGGAVLFAYAPWLVVFLEQLENRDHYAWFLEDWERWGALGAALRTFRSFSPGAEYLLGGLGKYGLWQGWPTLVATAVAGLGAVRLALGHRERGAVEALWPTLFLLVPILLSLATSLLLTPNYVPGRVDQMLFPAFALLVGFGFASLRPKPLRFALAAAMLLVAGWSRVVLYPGTPLLGRYVANGVRHEVPIDGTDRELADRVADRWHAGDVIVTTSLTRASLQYYLSRRNVDARFVSYPRETAEHLGSQNDARLLEDTGGLVREAGRVLEEARGLAGDGGRLFLVRTRAKVNGPLQRAALERRGFERLEPLGNFSQVGTSWTVEVDLYGLPAQP